MQSLDELIASRRSVRGYLPDPLDEKILHQLFEVSRRAPSNCNVQPFNVHVVSGASLVALSDKLLAAAQANSAEMPDFPPEYKYEGVYRERQFDAAATLYGAMGVERTDRKMRDWAFLRNYRFFGAPHAAFFFLPEPFGVREAADVGMFANTLMLTMHGSGIASCAQGSLARFPNVVRDHLGIDRSLRLLFGMSFGYEDTTAKANAAKLRRAPVEELVRFHA